MSMAAPKKKDRAWVKGGGAASPPKKKKKPPAVAASQRDEGETSDEEEKEDIPVAVPVGGEEADGAVAVATIVEGVDTDDDTASMQEGGGAKSKSQEIQILLLPHETHKGERRRQRQQAQNPQQTSTSFRLVRIGGGVEKRSQHRLSVSFVLLYYLFNKNISCFTARRKTSVAKAIPRDGLCRIPVNI